MKLLLLCYINVANSHFRNNVWTVNLTFTLFKRSDLLVSYVIVLVLQNLNMGVMTIVVEVKPTTQTN